MVENKAEYEKRRRFIAARMVEQEHSLVHVFNEYIQDGDAKYRQCIKEGKTLRDLQEEICAKIDVCVGHGTSETKAAKAKAGVRKAKSIVDLWNYFTEALHNSEGNSVKSKKKY